VQEREWAGAIRTGRLRRSLPLGLLGLACVLGVSSLAGTPARAQILTASLEPSEQVPPALEPATRHTADLVTGLTASRSTLILGTLPNVGDRADRMRGVIEIWKNPKPIFEALPDFANGKPIPMAASLRAYDKVIGNQQPTQLDAWIKGTFSILPTSGTAGQFGAVAIGVDHLIFSDFLVGGFAQGDGLLRGGMDPSLARGGWTLGGYGTWRLTDNLFLDALAGHGNSVGLANPSGSGLDHFDSDGWLLTTALAGDWSIENWRFTPKVRLRYFDEASSSYAAEDSLAAVHGHGGIGELGFSPAVTYLLTTENDIAVETGLKFETATGLSDAQDLWTSLTDFRGRLEGTIDLKLPTGTRLKSSLGYGGIGTNTNTIALKASLEAKLR